MSVWVGGPSEVWAVGTGGLVLRGNGRSFEAVASGTTQDLWRVLGRGTGEIWAVGAKGTVLRYNSAKGDKAFSEVPVPVMGQPDLYGLAMLNGQPLVLGAGGLILLWDDAKAAFAQVPSGVKQPLASAMVMPGGEVWIAGGGGTLLRSDRGGVNFRPVRTDVTAVLYSV